MQLRWRQIATSKTNAISVVTAQDIQNRGITQIAQLFRGEIPGVIALNNQDSPDGALVMLSRGRTSLTQADQSNTPAIKTYIDGIELADPRYLNQIDVNTIDRIEIIAGPQASTIYGSAALGGVMQIFTKRGSVSRPRVSGTFQSGTVENSFRSNFAPKHDYSLQLDGGDQRTTYQVGIGYKYDGRWTPGRYARTTLGNIGIRRTEGRLEMGATALISQRTAGNGAMNPLGVLGLNGLFRLNPSGSMVRDLETSNGQQTIGLTLTHQTRSWLTQALTVGRSNVTVETRRRAPSFSMPEDSTFDRSITPEVRQSVTYNMAARRQLGDAIDATMTLRGDYWNYKTHTVFAEQGPGDGSFDLTQLSAEDDENHGGFAQVQVGIFDRAFFTVGLRAENNTSFGENVGYEFTPRYGVSVTQDVADVSTRFRASYGRSTRPPAHEQTTPFYLTQPTYGTYQARLAAPDLLPEEQRGWESESISISDKKSRWG